MITEYDVKMSGQQVLRKLNRSIKVQQRQSPASSVDSPCCRVCLKFGQIPIFTQNTAASLTLHLKSICDINVIISDGYPKYLCNSCFDTLKAAVNLRITAKNTQLKLKELCLVAQSRNPGKRQLKLSSDKGSSVAVKKKYITEKTTTKLESSQSKSGQSFKSQLSNDTDIIRAIEKPFDAVTVSVQETNEEKSKDSCSSPNFIKIEKNNFWLDDISCENLQDEEKDIVIKHNTEVIDDVKLPQQEADVVDKINVKEENSCEQNEVINLGSEYHQVNKTSNISPKQINESKCKETSLTADLCNDRLNDSSSIKDEKCTASETNNCSAGILEEIICEASQEKEQVKVEEIKPAKKIRKKVIKIKENNTKHDNKTSGSKNSGSDDNLDKDDELKATGTSFDYTKYYRKERSFDKKAVFVCIICGKVLKKKSCDHITEHLSITPRFVCEVCGTGFKKQCAFLSHSKYHHVNELLFECKLCPYKGRNKELLRNHLKIHGQECKYLCPQCPKKFLNSGNFNRHLRRHAEPTFKCTYCNQSYYDSFKLKSHITNQHIGGTEPFNCCLCGNIYKTRRHLLRHEIKVHKREKKSRNRALYLKDSSKPASATSE